MSYRRRLLSFILVAVMVISAVSGTFSMSAGAITDAEFVAPEVFIPDYIALPDDDLLTDNASFTLAEGTRNEIDVISQFITSGKSNRPGTINYMKYIVIHNTGSYPVTSTALSNHNYGRTTTASVSWHYTCGNDGIYQMLPVNEKGWHAGGDYWTTSNSGDKVSDGSNSTGVGIETCVDGFPADAAFSGEHWNQDDMYDWYETHYDDTATYLAMLVAYLCVKLNFNPYTQIITHYQTAGKNCPMQMRYVFGTNATFKMDGTYFKVYRDRMYDYYYAFGGTYISSDTCQNTYYNSSYTSYDPGLYKANSAVTVYRAGNTATGSVGTIASGTVVDVDITGWNWGKVTLSDGTTGWVSLSSFTYVRNDYDYGTYKTSSGDIVTVTAISGSTATYSGGTADLSTLTRVYAVNVVGDTVFGTATKYLAKGESFTVTAEAPTGDNLFDIWEVTSGIASIASKTSETTTITVLNSDVTVSSSYRNEYDLAIVYGVGGGRYKAGTIVEIQASTRTGYQFTHWTIDSGSGTFGDANSFNTTFTMGTGDVTISANYETAGEIDTTGLTNYALNKTYTTTWKGSTDITYQYTNQQDTDRTKLTDGTKATTTYSTSDTAYVSFQGTTQKFGTTIDLGQDRNIRMVAICDFGDSGGSVGDYQSNSAEIEYSVDGSTYYYVENLTDTLLYSYASGTKLSNVYTHRVDFAWVTARYVRVTFTSASYVTAFTEIEVYGSDEVVESTPETLEFTSDATASGLYSKDESYVYGTALGMTAEELSTLFVYTVTVTNTNSETVASGELIATGYTVSSADESLVLVVSYDVDGDGNFTTVDMMNTLLQLKSSIELPGAYLIAADVDGDSAVTTTDYSLMKSKAANS